METQMKMSEIKYRVVDAPKQNTGHVEMYYLGKWHWQRTLSKLEYQQYLKGELDYENRSTNQL